MTTPEPMSPITEDDIADYLVNTPDFFERHASLLATVQLTHPQSHRTVGLQERQAQMLRDKIKGLEHRIMDMIRHGNENMILTDKLHRWSCDLLVAQPEHLAESALENIRELFQVPQVALRLWSLDEAHSQAPYAQGVTDAVKDLATSLDTPYVGPNTGYEAVQWLPEPTQAASLALLAAWRVRDERCTMRLIIRDVGDIPVAALDVATIAQLMRTWKAAGKSDHRCKNARGLLHRLLESAAREGIVEANPLAIARRAPRGCVISQTPSGDRVRKYSISRLVPKDVGQRLRALVQECALIGDVESVLDTVAIVFEKQVKERMG